MKVYRTENEDGTYHDVDARIFDDLEAPPPNEIATSLVEVWGKSMLEEIDDVTLDEQLSFLFQNLDGDELASVANHLAALAAGLLFENCELLDIAPEEGLTMWLNDKKERNADRALREAFEEDGDEA